MCYCVYLGADNDLPLVPFDAKSPIFSVQPVSASDAVVAQHFNKKNIYYVGSWQGCSCGFANDIDFENAELVAKNSNSVTALLNYISSALQQEDTIEFYTCWVGNEWQEPQERKRENLDSVEVNGFELQEDALLTFFR